MTGLYWIVFIFSALTLCFTYEEYKQGRVPKKALILVSIMEAVVMAAAIILIIAF